MEPSTEKLAWNSSPHLSLETYVAFREENLPRAALCPCSQMHRFTTRAQPLKVKRTKRIDVRVCRSRLSGVTESPFPSLPPLLTPWSPYFPAPVSVSYHGSVVGAALTPPETDRWK